MTTDITKRADGIYVYDPVAGKSADHDRTLADHDDDDQYADRAHNADNRAGAVVLGLLLQKRLLNCTMESLRLTVQTN